MIKYTITIDKISSNSGMSTRDLFLKMIGKEYNDSIGWGFSTLSILGTQITGLLLKEVTKYFNTWDEAQNTLIRQSYKTIKEIRFYIDIDQSFICVEGGLRDLNTLKQSLRQTLWNEFVYSSLGRIIGDYISIFENDRILLSIDEVTFVDYKVGDMFMGTYITKVLNSDTRLFNVDSYKEIIAKFKTTLKIDENFVKLCVSRTNSFSFSCDESIKQSFIDYLKTITY